MSEKAEHILFKLLELPLNQRVWVIQAVQELANKIVENNQKILASEQDRNVFLVQ